MPDAQLQILIKARNEAKGAFDSLNKQVGQLQGSSGFGGLSSKIGDLDSKFKSLTGVSLGFASAAGLAGAAISGVAKFLSESVNETISYATEIDNMSRLLGISTEETSRLVQASDDLFISQETLKGALQAASRQGIDVSIDGLKRLSEQYLALNPGVDRAQFLMKTFGRSGAEMGKLMEQGAEGLDAATSAIADNMVITEDSMDAIISYKQSIDNLNDSWQGVKFTVGQSVIPTLDLLFRSLKKGKDDVELNRQALNRLELQLDRAKSAGDAGTESAYYLGLQIAFLKGEYEKGEAGVSDFYAGISAMAGGINSEAIPATAGLGSNVSTVTQYFSALTEQMVFNKLAANMTAEAALALGVNMGLVDPMTYSLSLKMEALTTDYDDNGDGAIDAAEATGEYTEKVLALQDSVNGLHSKTIDIVVNWRGEGGGIGGAENMAGVDLNGNGVIGRAIGGPVSANTPYIVGEVGPELFVPNTSGTIIPNNKLTSGGGASAGGATVINFNYAPALSLSDRAEVETRIKPMLKRLLKEVG